jgi:hypothetical protein
VIQWWLRIKEERDDRSPHREAKQLVLVTLAWLSFVSIAAAQTSAPPNPDLPARRSDTEHLRGGWYPWDPYQYRDYRRHSESAVIAAGGNTISSTVKPQRSYSAKRGGKGARCAYRKPAYTRSRL